MENIDDINIADYHDHVFKVLRENQHGEINMAELSTFTRELMKSQVNLLRDRINLQKKEN